MKADDTHRVQLLVQPRRHVCESLQRTAGVLQVVLDGRLEIERLDKGCLLQRPIRAVSADYSVEWDMSRLGLCGKVDE